MNQPKTSTLLAILFGSVVGICLAALSTKCVGQTITITPVITNSQKVVITLDYSGQPTTVAAMNFKCAYDVTLLQFDSLVPLSPFDSAGSFTPMQPGSTFGWFAGFWFLLNMDSVWITNKPMYLVYFSVIAEGCSNFHWLTPPTDNCEISDITATPIATTWVDKTICIITTGVNLPVSIDSSPVGKRFDSIGREVPSGGYNALKRRLHKTEKP